MLGELSEIRVVGVAGSVPDARRLIESERPDVLFVDVEMPGGGFYLWPKTPVDDTEFTRRLYQTQGVSVLPGSYLARSSRGDNPGVQRVRVALVASATECTEAVRRIRAFVESL